MFGWLKRKWLWWRFQAKWRERIEVRMRQIERDAAQRIGDIKSLQERQGEGVNRLEQRLLALEQVRERAQAAFSLRIPPDCSLRSYNARRVVTGE